MNKTASQVALIAILLIVPIARSTFLLPFLLVKVNGWFLKELASYKVSPVILAAQRRSMRIHVKADGTGDFKTITAALASIPDDNTRRVIIKIGHGIYTENVMVHKHYVTLIGHPRKMPTLVFAGSGASTMIVQGNYFSCVNLQIVNNAPISPRRTSTGVTGVALEILGDAASFYNCIIKGIQDTLYDHSGRHFFKDCKIEGNYIFGSARSIYLNTKIHVNNAHNAVATKVQQPVKEKLESGFIFLHCKVTAPGKTAFLGRSSSNNPRVIIAYSDLNNPIDVEGWSNNKHSETSSNFYCGEYKNEGAGAAPAVVKRTSFIKILTDVQVKPYLTLDYIDASTWLLPPEEFGPS